MAQSSKKAKAQRNTGATRRLRVGLAIMLTLLLVVAGKLFLVQGLDVGGLAEAAQNNRARSMILPAARGQIVDEKGTVLATSVIRYDISIDQALNTKTTEFPHKDDKSGEVLEVSRDQGLSDLAKLLGMETAQVKELATGESAYKLMARNVKPDVADAIMALHVPGVVASGVSQRVYPNGAVAGGVVGFLQDGTTGQAGIEQTQDSVLKGKAGERSYEIGADGLVIPVAPDKLTPAENGKTVKLTLNSDIQYFAQQAIQTQVDKLNAEWGSIVIMDSKTGNLIALADTNSPDPNDPGKVAAEDRGVRSVTAAYEPGSVEKVLTASALIEEGKATPLSTYTIPPTYTVDGQTFSDAFEHGTEKRTLAGILGFSMNTGTVMAGQALSRQQRYDWLSKFGIGKTPDIPLPGVGQGILSKPDKWDDRQQYTVLFGQGVSQTTLQTVRAYQSIANNGVMLQPRLIDSYINPDGTEEKVPAADPQTIVSDSTAKQVRSILESNVTEGEIKEAAIDGYRIGAKTGTSESPCDNGQPGFCGYTASMVGMAPMDDPRFIVEIVVQRPKGDIYGISNGPTFRSVMSQVLRTYNVAPSTGKAAHLPQYAK
ncbi:peptidoglycan D,D-transpeptidase FtsI family protein [Pseudarthrobacter sp. J1738]|uniref:peptidoglycan D,D-transpeptidase FtsI family protein n=1 Tax=unclassified Pseudarthrobacter TaxID=2647000 RepID=UPI003D2DD558